MASVYDVIDPGYQKERGTILGSLCEVTASVGKKKEKLNFILFRPRCRRCWRKGIWLRGRRRRSSSVRGSKNASTSSKRRRFAFYTFPLVELELIEYPVFRNVRWCEWRRTQMTFLNIWSSRGKTRKTLERSRPSAAPSTRAVTAVLNGGSSPHILLIL